MEPMGRAGAPPLSFGHPTEGGSPPPMDKSLSKRPRPPSEAEQVRATLVAPRGPWPRPHPARQPCWPPRMGDSRLHTTATCECQVGTANPPLGMHIMAEAPLAGRAACTHQEPLELQPHASPTPTQLTSQ
eukprot:scaffold195574_cov26-Tisochrysis_lutea.AAC.1